MGTSMLSCVSLIFPITALPVFHLLLLCHKPNLLFRLVFDKQQLIEGFENNSKLSIRIRSEFVDLFTKFGIIEYHLTHLHESPHNLYIYLNRFIIFQDR